MAVQQLLKIVYALDIKFWVRWCTCSMWRMLLPYYLLFLISIILFLKTDIYVYYILSRTELARLVMGTIFLVILYRKFPLKSTYRCSLALLTR